MITDYKLYEKSIWDDDKERDDPYDEEFWPPSELTIKRDILSMGYREMKPHIYAKPFGYGLLTIEKNGGSLKITSWFKNNDKMGIWNSDDISIDQDPQYPNQILNDIKEFEAYTRTNIGREGDFHFLSKKEVAELIL